MTPGVIYQLAESGGDVRFPQLDNRTDASSPLSTGSMDCVEIDPNSGDIIPGFSDGINGGVTVPLGSLVQCTALNQAATLALRKVVVNNNGGTAVPSDWQLTATPVGPDLPAGLVPITVTGTDAELGEAFTVRPGVDYVVTESTVAGYQQVGFGCVFVPRQSGPATVNLGPLDFSVCTFTNTDQPAHLTLVKKVTNDNGGTAVPTDWTLSADGPTPISGTTGTPAVTSAVVTPGSYGLSETGPGGYTASAWTCEGGTLTETTVVVPVGGNVTCTITNSSTTTTTTTVPGSSTTTPTAPRTDPTTAPSVVPTMAGTLPPTGGDNGSTILAGFGALLAGGMLLWLTRRRATS